MRFPRYEPLRLLAAPLLAVGVLLIAGCGGCTDGQSSSGAAGQQNDQPETAKRRPNFEDIAPVALPGIYPDRNQSQDNLDEDEIKQQEQANVARNREVLEKNRVKLGHWVSSHYQVVANNFDSRGSLVLANVDAQNKPVPISGTDYTVSTTRPASLAKGEWKLLESTVFLPRRDIKTNSANVNFSLIQSGTGMNLAPELLPVYNTRLMLPFQFHFVVLSNRADAYAYLGTLDAVQMMERSVSTGDPFPGFYSVVPYRNGDPVPLPRNPLNWTTTAYILWDDFSADQLDFDQQTALLDWLHFGGQLILSGPDCLDKLQNSFLADYLPARFNQARNLVANDFDPLNQSWSVPVKKNPIEKRILKIPQGSQLLGVSFNLHPEANYVDGTGELVAERQLGRGRIVLTAFSLDDLAVINWRSFSSFFNGCLLRRPPRQFAMTPTSSVSFGWVGDNASIFDPLLGSTVRFTSRDLSATGTGSSAHHQFEAEVAQDRAAGQFFGVNPRLQSNYEKSIESEFKISGRPQFSRNRADTWHYGGFDDDRQSGIGGWSDESGIALAARNTLKDAAGISPPSSTFVLQMLAGYLLVLIPLNWLVFRVIGRVEWAWVAAPIIAIAGAFLVARMASLDIGFVRSNTQIGLLEMHGDYPRGHLTEYSALYTSLSTNYAVELDNSTSQSLPFAASMMQRFKSRETPSNVSLERSQANRLDNFQIQSNSTGLLHTEHLVDLDGPIRIVKTDSAGWTVENNTNLTLSNAGILYRETEQGPLQLAWVGEISPGAATDKLAFRAVPEDPYQEWASRSDLFVSSERAARQLWQTNLRPIPGNPRISIAELREFEGIEDRWADIQKALQRTWPADTLQQFLVREISYNDFLLAYSLAEKGRQINAGRMFDTIVQNLDMGVGEVRLIASTSEQIGSTEFSPRSTQTERITLILVHLCPPQLGPATRDSNCLADIRSPRSSLDFEDAAREIENSGSGQNP